MSKLANVLNYALPFLCLANIFLATNTDAQIAWFIATMGWGAHLFEMRKHAN